MKQRIDADGRRLPIKLDATSNGEFEPVPLSPLNRAAKRLAHERATANARRVGLSRRDFLVSSCGAASTLLAFNAANAAAGKTGGRYALAAAAAVDPELAAAQLEGREFVFDVQGHYVNPTGAWLAGTPAENRPLSWSPKTACTLAAAPGDRSYLRSL